MGTYSAFSKKQKNRSFDEATKLEQFRLLIPIIAVQFSTITAISTSESGMAVPLA